jgi:MFS family permease
MSSTSQQIAPQERMSAQDRKVLAGTLVGTTIEWYDFIIYAQAAGLVFAHLYFTTSGEGTLLAQTIAWASLGISFLFRPLGAIVAGHIGDKYGRKSVLVSTLILMGVSTTLIGVLPTYAQIGVWAPILLVSLRVLQGFSAGGEWGGAALMAVEHAPVKRRGLFGVFPQIGVPAGMILATLVIFTLTSIMDPEDFLAWGWRIPFLGSVVLIIVGYFIRRSVAESPVFQEMAERKRETATPLRLLFKTNSREVILTAAIFIGSNAAGYMLITFFSSYAVRTLGMNQPSVLLMSVIAASTWLVFTMYGGILSDRFGRIRVVRIGYALLFIWMIPAFLLVDTKNIWFFGLALIVFSLGNGLAYGPVSALFAEMFPASVRYSGISIGYALGSILGGAFAPMIAESLLGSTGTSISIAGYIMVLCLISVVGTIFVKDPSGVDLRHKLPNMVERTEHSNTQ